MALKDDPVKLLGNPIEAGLFGLGIIVAIYYAVTDPPWKRKRRRRK